VIRSVPGPIHLSYVVQASDTTARFLRAILERRLLATVCPGCAAIHIPPRGACPRCAARSTTLTEVGPEGTITTFSVIRIPFEGQRVEPPYACAHVLLDGSSSPLLHIVAGCSVEEVKVGMRVRPVWSDQPEPSLASVRYFEPVREGE
jgi:uncharacterized OB-fold protein